MTLKRLPFLLILALLLAACQAAPAPAEPTPTALNDGQFTAMGQEGYPVVTAPAVDPNAYPAGEPTVQMADPGAYPGPPGMPALENRSKVTARLSSQDPDTQDPAYVRLTAEILTSEPIQGYPDRTTELIGKTVELYVPAAGLPALNPGDSFEAEVNFVGDEFGGKYFASQVKTIE